jgi:class 3 adenylate cyclase
MLSYEDSCVMDLSICRSTSSYLLQKGSGVDPTIQWDRTFYKRQKKSQGFDTKDFWDAGVDSRSEISDQIENQYRHKLHPDPIADQRLDQVLLVGDDECPDRQEDVFLSLDHDDFWDAGMDKTSWNRDTRDGPRVLTDSDIEPRSMQGRYSQQKGSEYSESVQSCRSFSSLSSLGSSRLTGTVLEETTVLFIDIKGFTVGCSQLTAGQVGEWVVDFYATVDRVAAAHGVRKAEVRGDCCVCVTGISAEVWRSVGGGEDDGRDVPESQVTRMLAFAAELHGELGSMVLPGGAATSVRMGVASGQVTFMVGSALSGGGGFVSVQGDTVAQAARMEALSSADRLLVHASSALRWAAEAPGRSPPATVALDCGGALGPQEAAAYLLAARSWARRGEDGGCEAAVADSAPLAAAVKACAGAAAAACRDGELAPPHGASPGGDGGLGGGRPLARVWSAGGPGRGPAGRLGRSRSFAL